MNIALSIVLMLVALCMFVLGCRAIYFAFVKKKDERSKWIVTKSMANAFVVMIILQALQFLFKMISYDFYLKWWSAVKEAIYIDPLMFSFIVLGIVLIINTKRHGGSL